MFVSYNCNLRAITIMMKKREKKFWPKAEASPENTINNKKVNNDNGNAAELRVLTNTTFINISKFIKLIWK